MQECNSFKKNECNRFYRRCHLLFRWDNRWDNRRIIQRRQSLFMSKLTHAPVGASENKLAYHRILSIIYIEKVYTLLFGPFSLLSLFQFTTNHKQIGDP